MAISVVQFAGSSAANNGSGTMASLTGVTAGNDIIIAVLSFNSTYTLVDSNGTPVKDVTWNGNVSSYRLTIWSVLNCNSGTHNFSLSGGSTNSAVHAYEVSGLATASAFDQSGTANGGGGSVTATTAGATAVNDELTIAVAHAANESFTPSGGATENETSEATFGQHLSSEYLIVSTTGTKSLQWTRSPALASWSACIATYQIAGAAAGQPTRRRWGGVPHVGGLGSGRHGSGRMWGRTRSGIYVPNHLREAA